MRRRKQFCQHFVTKGCVAPLLLGEEGQGAVLHTNFCIKFEMHGVGGTSVLSHGCQMHNCWNKDVSRSSRGNVSGSHTVLARMHVPHLCLLPVITSHEHSLLLEFCEHLSQSILAVELCRTTQFGLNLALLNSHSLASHCHPRQFPTCPAGLKSLHCAGHFCIRSARDCAHIKRVLFCRP